MKEAVLVIIENSKGSVLMLDRNIEPLGWGLPGGKVEENDINLFAAAVREVKEETGIDIDSNFLEKIDECLSINGRILHIFTYKFSGRMLDKELIPKLSSEHKDYKWIFNLNNNLNYSGNTKNFFRNFKFKI